MHCTPIHSNKRKKETDKKFKSQDRLLATPLNGILAQYPTGNARVGGKIDEINGFRCCEKGKKKNRFIVHSRESNHAGHWYISNRKQAHQTLNETLTKGKVS